VTFQNASNGTSIISTKADKETLAGIFRLITGRQNSVVEIFPRPALVNLKDIQELNKNILEKLNRHSVVPPSFSAIVAYTNNRSEELNNFDKFDSSIMWSTHYETESIHLKWDFFTKFEDQQNPSTHSLSVRIANSMHPAQFFQAILSKQPEDIESLEVKNAPMSCRVDFVDNILSQELIALVSNWNKTLRSPEAAFPILLKLRNHDDLFSSLITHLIPLLTAFGYVGWFYSKYHSQREALDLFILGIWLLGSFFVIRISKLLAGWLSRFCARQLNRIGRFTVFELTQGDSNAQNRFSARSSGALWKFVGGVTSAIVYKVTALVVSAYWFNS